MIMATTPSSRATAYRSPTCPATLLLALAGIVAADCGRAQDHPPLQKPTRRVAYRSFEGAERRLFPWPGERVTILTRAKDQDLAAMQALLTVCDDVYAFYADATGRSPQPRAPGETKLAIAEEAKTCGAGCGYLGTAGIEIMPEFLTVQLQTLAKGAAVDQVLPYEFGRNFWFYSDQLEYHEPQSTGTVTTGYAVLMRFWAIEALGREVGPFNGHPGAEFLAAVEALVDTYTATPKATWQTTLAVGSGIDNPMGLGATDLFASFLMRVRRDHADRRAAAAPAARREAVRAAARSEFVRQLWREVAQRPKAATSEAAVDNLVIACSLAADEDLVARFRDEWRFPVSAAAAATVARALRQK